MIAQRLAQKGVRYLVRVWNPNHDRWLTIGTFGDLAIAREAEAKAKARYPAKRRCVTCQRAFTPVDDRRVRCDACVLRNSPPTREDHWVYRCYTEDDRLLYVGITSTGIKRFRRHGNERDWWQDVARIEIEHCEDRAAAERRELELIGELRPPHNTKGLSPVSWGAA